MASTRLDEIEGLATPAGAPRTLRLSAANVRAFQSLWRQSFPGGHSRERGGTLFADSEGRIGLGNIAGIASDSNSFKPDLAPKPGGGTRAIGTFHTHPYDATENWVTGVSFSGADIAYMINKGLILNLLQSGPRLFAFVRTRLSPRQLPYAETHAKHALEITPYLMRGITYPQASRMHMQAAAAMYGLAYYQGSGRALTRVHPA